MGTRISRKNRKFSQLCSSCRLPGACSQNDDRTSKSCPSMRVVNTSDFQIGKTQGNLTLFRSSTSRVCSEPLIFFTLLTSKSLQQEAFLHFWEVQLPKVATGMSCLTLLAFDFQNRTNTWHFSNIFKHLRTSTSKPLIVFTCFISKRLKHRAF